MSNPSKPRPFALWVLIILQAFLSFSAIVSGGMLFLSPDGSWMMIPLSMLEGSPFKSFFIPGLTLFTFLGVYPGLVAYSLLKRPSWRWPNAINPFKKIHWCWAGSLAVSAIMFGWLTVELFWFPFEALQAICYTWGAILLVLTLLPAVRKFYTQEK